MPAGASALSFYIPVTPSNTINCEVGAAGTDANTTGGDTSFGDNLVLGGGEYLGSETSGELGHVSSCVNFSGESRYYDCDSNHSYVAETTPWGFAWTSSPEIGYGVGAEVDGYGATGVARPGLLIVEYVDNHNTLVLTESQTITVPGGVTGALISGCGAGGGTGTTSRAPEPGSFWGGGAGGSVINYYVPLTAGDSIECVVGEAGISGSNGGDTKFGSYVTLGGGENGAVMKNGATGTVPSGVNLSKDSFSLTGGYTPFGRSTHYEYVSGGGDYTCEAVGYGAGADGSISGAMGPSLNGLLIIQWVRP